MICGGAPCVKLERPELGPVLQFHAQRHVVLDRRARIGRLLRGEDLPDAHRPGLSGAVRALTLKGPSADGIGWSIVPEAQSIFDRTKPAFEGEADARTAPLAGQRGRPLADAAHPASATMPTE